MGAGARKNSENHRGRERLCFVKLSATKLQPIISSGIEFGRKRVTAGLEDFRKRLLQSGITEPESVQDAPLLSVKQ